MSMKFVAKPSELKLFYNITSFEVPDKLNPTVIPPWYNLY